VNPSSCSRPNSKSFNRHNLFVITCGLALLVCASSDSAQTASPRDAARRAPVTVQTESIAPPAAIPKPPPPPPVPEKMPPEPPLVTYDGARLTIFCDNSTLADVLSAVREQTGADIDIPPSASRERIAARLGPAPARDVLTSLLSGTNFDYVVQAADNDEQAVQMVILTPRQKASGGSAVASSHSAWPVRRAAQSAPEPDPAASEPDPSDDAEQPTASAVPVPTADATPAGPQPDGAGAPPAPPPANTPPPTESLQAAVNEAPPAPADTNTGEAQTKFRQMTNELQRMYQQRMQMQEEARKGSSAN
jgi:hypothetical protein